MQVQRRDTARSTTPRAAPVGGRSFRDALPRQRPVRRRTAGPACPCPWLAQAVVLPAEPRPGGQGAIDVAGPVQALSKPLERELLHGIREGAARCASARGGAEVIIGFGPGPLSGVQCRLRPSEGGWVCRLEVMGAALRRHLRRRRKLLCGRLRLAGMRVRSLEVSG